MGAGNIIAIIGAILGIISLALFYVMPEIFCFWRFDAGAATSRFLGGFWSRFIINMGIERGPESAEDTKLLLVGVLVIAGGSLALISAFLENKV